MAPDFLTAASAFFLNLTIILLAISLYQAFYIDKIEQVYERRNVMILSIITSVATILCMTFPVSNFLYGYLFDLRFVPFLLAAVYGGPIPAIVTSISMITYRYFLGGEGFYVTLIVQSLCLLTFLYVYPKLKINTYRSIINICILFTFFLGFLIFTVGILTYTHANFDPQTYGKFVLYQIGIHLIIFWITISLIDNLLRRVRNRNYLRRTDRLHAVTELTASVAHEIRNPLTAAKGFLQLLLRESILNHREKEYAQLIDREVQRVEKIVDEYLSIAHPHPVQLSLIQLDKLLQKVALELAPFCESHFAKIDVSIKKRVEFFSDEEKLLDILQNIIINGIEAMPDGGIITINADRSKKYVIIEIHDQGIGMSEKELDRIGTPFYSLKEKGTGLGLMLCFQLIDSLDGYIEVRSTRGHGSTFSVYLPITQVASSS